MWLFGKQGPWAQTAQRRGERSYRRRNRLLNSGSFLERLEDRRLLAITAAYDSVTDTLAFTASASVTVDFDALVATPTPVSGAALANYLDDFGITIADVSPNITPVVTHENNPPQGFHVGVPASPPNYFITNNTDNNPYSYRVNFAEPLNSFVFTRIQYDGSGPSGLIVAPWNARAIDSGGATISSVSEGQLAFFGTQPAQQFTLNGPGIAAVIFERTTFNAIAGLNAVPTDNWILMSDANNELTITASDPTSSTVSFSTTDPGGIILAPGTTNPQSMIASIAVNLGGGNDSLTVNGSSGADTIAVNGTTVTFVSPPPPDVTYTLSGVENLTIDGRGGADNISATGITVPGALVVNGGTGADTLSLNSAISTTLDTGALTIADPDATDDVALRGTVATDALAGQDYQTDVTLLGNTTLNAGAGDISFDQEISGPLFDLQPDSSGATTFSGAVNVGGLTTFGGGQTRFAIAAPLVAVLTAGNQIYNNPVLLLEDTILTSNGQGIFFNGFVDAADNAANGSDFGLTVNTPLGNNIFNSEVGGDNQGPLGIASDPDGLEFLITDATGAGGRTELNVAAPLVAVTTAGDQNYNDAVLLGANIVLAGNDISFNSTLNSAVAPRTLAVNTTGVGVTTFGGVVGDTLALTSITTNADGRTEIGAGTINVNGPSVTFNDPVLLTANLTIAEAGAGNITFNSTVDSEAGNNFSLTVNTGTGATIFNGAVGSDALAALSADTGLGAVTTNVAGTTQINGGSVTTTGNQTYNDPVTLAANAILNAGAGNITFAQSVTGAAFSLTANSTGTTTFGDAVGDVVTVQALTTNAGGSTVLNGGTVTTTGNQTYNDPVTLGANTTLNAGAGNITFAQTVTGAAFSLAANSTGTTTFDGAVNVASLTTNDGGTTAINGGTVTTTGNQTYNDPVTLGNNTTLNAGAGNITFDETVTGAFSLAANSTGTTTFGGAVNVGSLTTNAGGTTAINGGTVTTTGDQIYNDPVTLNAAGNATTLSSTTGSVTFNNTLNSFQLNEEDLTINAGTNVTFNNTVGGLAGGRLDDLDVNAGNNISLNLVNVTNTVDLTATGGAIIDLNADVLNVDATALIATANDGITLHTKVATITASNTGAGATGDITLVEEDAVTLTSVTNTAAAGNVSVQNKTGNLTATLVSATGADGDVALLANNGNLAAASVTANDNAALTATNGNLTIGSVTAGNDVTLSATTGSISDDPADAAADVTAADLFATANDGITLQTNVATITASNVGAGASGNITLVEEDAVTLTSVINTGGSVDVRNKTGNMTATLVSATAAGADVLLTVPNGNLVMGSVTANDDVTLSAVNGAITDGNAAALNVTGDELTATARNGIELDTAVARLVQLRNTTSGDIVIREEDSLLVREVVNDARDAIIVSKGHLLMVENVAGIENFAKRNFILSVSDLPNAMPSDDVVIAGKVRAQEIVSLIAGDDITLEGTSDVQSIGSSTSSFVYMKVDVVNVDPAEGGTLILLGVLRGNNALQYPLVAEGDAGDDLFSIQNLRIQNVPGVVNLQSPIAILGRGGTLDNTFITLTDDADDVQVFATIVDLVGKSFGGANPIEVTYVDNEQLDLVTFGGDDTVFVQMPEPAHGILANIIRTSTGEGEDLLKINGSTLNDSIRVTSYTTDPNFRFQVRGDTFETECLHVFGFLGDDIIENSAPVSSLLDGSFGRDFITGGDVAAIPAPGGQQRLVYDVIFGGPDADTIFARTGDDFLFPDHLFDQTTNTGIQTVANGDVVDSGFGFDTIVSLGNDQVVRNTQGDEQPDRIIGQGLQLTIIDFLNARFSQATPENVAEALQEGIERICKKILIGP